LLSLQTTGLRSGIWEPSIDPRVFLQSADAWASLQSSEAEAFREKPSSVLYHPSNEFHADNTWRIIRVN
jgi:hypothetical protein